MMRFLAAALALLLAQPAMAQTVPPERILRMVPNADLQSLDPINTTAGVVQSHAHMIYDQLFGRDENQRPQPQMVAEWSVSPDALTWRFALREGLVFHDGQPVTATDVVASLRRWGARDPHGRQILAITEALEPGADGRTILWRLRRPYGLMLDALSKPAGNMPAIMPARVAATDPFTNITETVGSGPFIFGELFAGAGEGRHLVGAGLRAGGLRGGAGGLGRRGWCGIALALAVRLRQRRDQDGDRDQVAHGWVIPRVRESVRQPRRRLNRARRNTVPRGGRPGPDGGDSPGRGPAL
ncbi:hypothetical protein J4558_26350 [Leptolyngbya sp. 15MV]|nr:hypothetical protein J4558_26350 [Leptolyngbya sp. 15MV]